MDPTRTNGESETEALRARVAYLEADRDQHQAAADELRASVHAALQAVPLQFWVAGGL